MKDGVKTAMVKFMLLKSPLLTWHQPSEKLDNSQI